MSLKLRRRTSPVTSQCHFTCVTILLTLDIKVTLNLWCHLIFHYTPSDGETLTSRVTLKRHLTYNNVTSHVWRRNVTFVTRNSTSPATPPSPSWSRKSDDRSPASRKCIRRHGCRTNPERWSWSCGPDGGRGNPGNPESITVTRHIIEKGSNEHLD